MKGFTFKVHRDGNPEAPYTQFGSALVAKFGGFDFQVHVMWDTSVLYQAPIQGQPLSTESGDTDLTAMVMGTEALSDDSLYGLFVLLLRLAKHGILSHRGIPGYERVGSASAAIGSKHEAELWKYIDDVLEPRLTKGDLEELIVI